MDAGKMLKPMLARGEIQLVGATTVDEFRELIEKDPALDRRFQQVFVDKLLVDDTIAILRALKGRYEAHHQVRISDAALVAAATLSDRYITDRLLPDKAIDLMDEAASLVRMELDLGPVEIDEMRRAVDRMKMEELGLAYQEDAASKDRLERLRATVADRQDQINGLMAQWELGKASLHKVGELMRRLNDLEGQAERAQREGDYEAGARLLYGEIPAVQAELAEVSTTARSASSDKRTAAARTSAAAPMAKEEVGPNDVAEVVSAWTGTPADRLLEGEIGELPAQA
jgi:ATP-dependent Clp protease ATP-binding subunit ClpB